MKVKILIQDKPKTKVNVVGGRQRGYYVTVKNNLI